MPTSDTTYTVTIHGVTVARTHDLEDAIRAWDLHSYNTVIMDGQIEVRSPLRHGSILHVRDSHIYLNPNLADVRAQVL